MFVELSAGYRLPGTCARVNVVFEEPMISKWGVA